MSRLSIRDACALGISSTAPAYSAVVTAPLIIPLVGGGVPLVYLLAAIPSWFVCKSMVAHNQAMPSKGSIYTWAHQHPTLAWISGFALAVTGIIATSSLAYVPAVLLVQPLQLGSLTPYASATIAIAITALALVLNVKSVKLTAVIQTLGVVLQLTALCYVLWNTPITTLFSATISGSPMDWIHAILLAVFAYWGFDAVFALAEESDQRAPGIASLFSLWFMVAFFALMAIGVLHHGETFFATHPLLAFTTGISSLLALGSTMIPTVRGIEAMAEANDLPTWLSNRTYASITVCALASLWTLITIFNEGFFNDSIESLSIFVGIYFMVSSYTAITAHYPNQGLHRTGFALISLVTLLTTIHMFSSDYSETTFAGIGGVPLATIVVISLGIMLFLSTRKRSVSMDQLETLTQ